MKELTCHICTKVILGRGVLLMNDRKHQEDNPWDHAPSLDDGTQYMALHPMCFDMVWDNICQIEDHNVFLSLAFGGVGDILEGLTTDEDKED